MNPEDNKVESIIDNINLIEELDDAADLFFEVIQDHSISRRAAFAACVKILTIYGMQKKWTAAMLKEAISQYVDINYANKPQAE